MGKHLKQKSAPVKTELKKKKYKSASVKPTPPRKTFLDMIAPGVMKFNPDVYIRDNLYCCVWALKEYPAATEDQAILRHLGEKCGVNIRIYTRIVDAMEENRIIQNATNKNRLSRANTNDTKQILHSTDSNVPQFTAVWLAGNSHLKLPVFKQRLQVVLCAAVRER